MSPTQPPKNPTPLKGDPRPDTSKSGDKGGKTRLYALAAEMKLDTKVVLDLCQELGFSQITSTLKSLEPDQVTSIKSRVKNGPAKPAPMAAAASVVSGANRA